MTKFHARLHAILLRAASDILDEVSLEVCDWATLLAYRADAVERAIERGDNAEKPVAVRRAKSVLN